MIIIFLTIIINDGTLKYGIILSCLLMGDGVMLTNKEFAKQPWFIKTCAQVLVGKKTTLKPTKRQASKYRLGKGKLFKACHSKAV
jgi:hypothetical protein